MTRIPALLLAVTLASGAVAAPAQPNFVVIYDTGLAPEITDLNAADVSYAKEKEIEYLEKPFVSTAPADLKDGIPVGRLGVDGGNRELVLAFARELAGHTDDQHLTDSLLISHKGKLVFESYYRRGRLNYPHYQMSITKSYTALALGRAIQLGHFRMDDLHKPVVDFLKEVDRSKIVEGAERITLDKAMHMGSGIRLDGQKVKALMKDSSQLRGQGQVRAYLENTAPVPEKDIAFKYQASDPALAMQVVEAVVPGSAEAFLRTELLGRMGITNYGWQEDLSGLPKSAAGCSMRSRDMLKIGMMMMAGGKWNGEQLIPEAFVKRALSPLAHSYGTSHYGYFWWVDDFKVGDKTYHCPAGRGAGGQFILMFPGLELIVVITAHNKGMGTMLQDAPKRIIPAFVAQPGAVPGTGAGSGNRSLLFPNSDFEAGTLENWTPEGEAFTVQPTKGDNPTARRRGQPAMQQGDYWIGTFEKYDGKTGAPGGRRGDQPTGTLTSIPFKVNKRYIVFRVGGGSRIAEMGVKLVCGDEEKALSAGSNSETMRTVSVDVSAFLGKTVRLVVYDHAKKGFGHINADDFRAADEPAGRGATPGPVGVLDEPVNYDTFDTYLDVAYDQSLRPQFHFTSRKNWLNDPNGMVYYDGEWHMYFQHVAIANNTGPKSWGNAKSADLVRWKQYPHAINPYPNIHGQEGIHAIWSGSAVVDVLNALGKQKGDVKTLFALYTATNPDGFFQGGAYSTDRGRTWTKINDGKPVIPHQEGYSRGQRDPRIFYYAPGRFYVTIMMVGGKDRAVRLWKSTDLLNWETLFDIPNKAAECIDMYEVAVDPPSPGGSGVTGGDPKNKKWVIANAGTGYEVGEFDGKSWKGYGSRSADGRPLRFDYGDSYYAAQAFNQAPDGRVVHIGWLRSKTVGYRPFLEAGMPFTQQMSIPAEITLRTTPDGIRMSRNPVKEIEELYKATHRFERQAVRVLNEKLRAVQAELVDLTLVFRPRGDLALNVRGLEVAYAAEGSEFVFENRERVEGIRKAWKKDQPFRDNGIRRIPAPLVDGKVTLRALVDRASLELFVNGGQAAASFVVVPKADNRAVSIEGDNDLVIESLVVNELKSIWR